MKRRLNIVAEAYKELMLAQEEQANGVTQVENEIALYARMMDQDLLKHASGQEEQEQWELKVRDSFGKQLGRIRVRKIFGQIPQFIQTVKIKNEDGHQDETSFEITEDVFNQIKKLCDVGMHKVRYYFDVEGRPEKWEVDTFTDADGKMSDFVKIDFEFAEGQSHELPKLPLGFINVIRGDTTIASEREIIQRLYNEVFLIHKHPVKPIG